MTGNPLRTVDLHFRHLKALRARDSYSDPLRVLEETPERQLARLLLSDGR